VDLLWAPAQQLPVRGPKPRLSLADVVAAGVAIADADQNSNIDQGETEVP